MQAAKDWTGPAWWVYKYSLLYLALLFVAMAIDRKVGI
jgi:protoheme IX farnesyltransferase